MDATGTLVIVLCVTLILAGAVTIRRPRRRRAMGAIALALGVIGILAWTAVENDSPPPPNATPTHGLIATVTPTADAP